MRMLSVWRRRAVQRAVEAWRSAPPCRSFLDRPRARGSTWWRWRRREPSVDGHCITDGRKWNARLHSCKGNRKLGTWYLGMWNWIIQLVTSSYNS